MKEKLEKMGVKVVEFAKALGISPSQASLYVHGWARVPKKHEEKISQFFTERKKETKK